MRTGDNFDQSEHHLQLFDSSKSLAETVTPFLRAGFDRGEPLLIVAAPRHRELLIRRLEETGLNVREAQLAGRVMVLDAEQTLEKFMRLDMPNRIAFDEVVGGAVASLSNGRRACIYGEMVDVLAARGNYKAAIQLEEFWNILGTRESFSLLCGYASGHFGDLKTAKALVDICACHGHVHRKSDDLLAEFLLDQHVAAPSPSQS